MKLLTFKATTHSTTPARIGTPTGSAAMEALLGRPGPVELKTFGTPWEANLSGLLNLKHPKAVQAGLTDRKEPIQIYTHVVLHPEHGFFLVDTGVAERLVADPAGVGVGAMLRKYGGVDKMRAEPGTARIIASQGVPLAGVFMTHLHLDLPPDVPICTGAREAEASLFLNLFAQGTNNHLRDPHPGHTTGHVSCLARITAGPALMTGDVCHTRWGWDNDVEPGTFLAERDASRDSLLAMKALSKRHPAMTVKLGHQP
ncbi:Zn-dependent hydrolase [Streptomyces sp. V2]|uniref:hypothetical protein n=1 Tax=Streptomyces TaxID=1883 RepID=UPI0006EB2BBF|nr:MULTISPECIES: hypothetical protein [Streptomyces]PWG15297.1 Zn-dependent hydrolase [Streptomyces sp. V2]